MTAAEPTTEGTYRDRIVAVEPGGNEFIAEEDRHGKPSQLFWTWTSPNLEFATIFVGVLAVAVYGMTFGQAVAGIVIGTGLGAMAHYVLSARGPLHGVPQMVLGRLPFGFKGNAVPAVLMSVTAGVGWFATNSVSGAFALATLFHIGPLLALVLIVLIQTALAFFGHNLVQAFERWAFPVLAVIFAIASVVILTKSHVGAPAVDGGIGGMGGFLLTVGTAFGYAAGWTPYAADYTRYLPSTVSGPRTGLFASAGLFVSCVVLEVVGAASVTIGPAVSENPTEAFTAELGSWLAKATLLAIAIGAIAANAINVYSGAMAFVTIGIKLPAHVARALVTVFFGVAGFAIAWWALADAAASYEAFLLIIAYWIGPWLGVVFADQYLRRGQPIAGFLYDRTYTNWPGFSSFVIGLLVSVVLFCNQVKFQGYVVRAFPDLGDITFFVGFLLAGGLYLLLCRSKISGERFGGMTPAEMLEVAVAEARKGLAEGGIPIGAALFTSDGVLLGSGHNRRVQNDDPSVHGETDAFRNAGRQRDYRSTVMVTTLSPCWYCSGLVRQFHIGAVVIGESRTFSGGHDWLAEHGVAITLLDDERCVGMMADFIAANPALWNEDIGVSE